MIFCDSYLPGYRGGGGMWSVRNLAERFCDRYDFFIITRDCDGKLDDTPYVSVARDKWNVRPEARVFYASPATLNQKNFVRLVNDIQPDAIYLNSIFSKVCGTFLLARRIASLRRVNLVIAPCGELSEAALGLKNIRKSFFVAFARLSGVFQNVLWKATSEAEVGDINQAIRHKAKVMIASELAPLKILPDFSMENKPNKKTESVRFVYFSRVTPKKNLHFLLQLLKHLNYGEIKLDVVGPADEEAYLARCAELSNELPSNISVNFLGGVPYEAALEIVLKSHFMVLPTLNENFGYVIIEALAAGCPVIASDQIAWHEIEKNGVGWRLPLSAVPEWVTTLEKCVQMPHSEYVNVSYMARKFAVKWLAAEKETESANAKVLEEVLEGAAGT